MYKLPDILGIQTAIIKLGIKTVTVILGIQTAIFILGIQTVVVVVVVGLLLYVPSQQLWSLQDGQFT